ncbi:MAG: tetratricopeptide repeat protein, partial [Gemmatimonadota bacterium]
SVAGLQRGITAILYGYEPERPKASIAQVLRETIESDGVAAGIERYRELREHRFDEYEFGERELNRLGYYFLGAGDIPAAVAVFKLNVESYPQAFNTYDSLGEAYIEAGQKDLAIKNYRKSLELNPGNDNARAKLAELGVESGVPEKME